MSAWICRTCAVEQPDTDKPPASCAICSDERQYVRPTGQQWTTLAELAAAGRGGTVAEVEPGLYGITIEPSVGIGQRALLVRTRSGNLLWDPTGYVDDDMVADFRQQLVADGVKIDEAGWAEDLNYIKAMIRFEIDIALFGVSDAWRHLITVDPQAQMALSQFGEAQKLLSLNKANTKAH